MEEIEPETNEDEKGYSSGELHIVEEDEQAAKKTIKKRRRSSRKKGSSDEEIEELPKDCVETEQKLLATAAKNRLTAANVKNILKRVVSNEHVLALVKIKEEELEEEEQIPSPKITRSKAKEIKKLKPKVSWPLPITPVKTPPVKVTSPEVSKLIAQDLPEEESDEEYQPNMDENSDDERDTISSMSDVDSQPRTPATPGQLSDSADQTPTKWSEDGLFKVPFTATPSKEIKEEPTIALRTRSKLRLNDTSIEAIEQSFVPPDEDCDEELIDNVWTDFLMEFSNPKTPTEPLNEDDEEMDPEYNAEHEKVEEEEIWGDDEDIEVTKNEFNTLLTELYESMDAQFIAEFQDGIIEPLAPNINLIPTIIQESHQSIKSESPVKILDISKSCPSLAAPPLPAEYSNPNLLNVTKKLDFKTEITEDIDIPQDDTLPNTENAPENNNCAEDSMDEYANISVDDLKFKKKRRKKFRRKGIVANNKTCPDWIYKDGDGQLTPEQRQILDQQMRQHVQIIAQNYIQLFGHPKHWKKAAEQKEYLVSLKLLSQDKPYSAFRPCNLLPAIELGEAWEESLAENTQENKDLIWFVNEECEKSLKYAEKTKYRKRYTMKFAPKLADFVLESKGVFLYPQLLPKHPVRIDILTRTVFLPSEERLTAIGLEEFVQYAHANPKFFPSDIDKCTQYKRKLIELITKYLVIRWTPTRLARRINEISTGIIDVKDSAIKHYVDTGKAPETQHEILPYDPDKKVYELDTNVMRRVWSRFCIEKLRKQKIDNEPNKAPGGKKSRSLQSNKENTSQTLINCQTDDKSQIEQLSDVQKVGPLQTKLVVARRGAICDNDRSGNRNHLVLIEIIDEFDKETHQIQGPVALLNSNVCTLKLDGPVELINNVNSSLVTNLNNGCVNVQETQNTTSERLSRKRRNVSSESSTNSSEEDNKNLESLGRLVIDYPSAESTPYCHVNSDVRFIRNPFESQDIRITQTPSCVKVNESVCSFRQCNCSCSVHNASNVLTAEPLPKGQTLLTKYFKKVDKVDNKDDSVRIHKKVSTTEKDTVNSNNTLVIPENGAPLNKENDQSNFIDSTSVPESSEVVNRLSNLYIYNGEGHTLKTLLSNLRCLLYVNWKKKLNRGSNKLKSNLAQAAKAKLFREVYEVGSNMLPSMPHLSTPSKSSFEDEYNELNVPLICIAENLNNSSVESSLISNKDVTDSSNTSVVKVVDERPNVSQNKSSSSKTNASHSSSKVSVKSTKAQKEFEANKAMFATSDPFADDLKDTTFATAYFEKVQERLTAKSDAELGGRDDFFEFQNILSTFDPENETPCDLYYKLEKLFGVENDDLTEEFLTFLTAAQAVQIGRFMDHFQLTSMTDFIERLQIYFARRPTQLRKILWSLNQIVESMDSSDDSISVEKIKTMILPHLKGNQYLTNWFMKLFPIDKTQESLPSSGYEILDTEKLSKDVNTDDPSQLDKFEYEILHIPNIEDTYGTDSCACDCHNTVDEKYKTRNKHCLSCGMRYVQGRLYVPHGRGFRPGRVSWSSDEEAKRQAVRLGLVQNKSLTLSTSSNPSGTAISSSGNPTGSITLGKKRAASHESHAATKESDDERVSPRRNVKFVRTPTSKTKYSKLQLIKTSKNGDSEDPSKPTCSKSIIKLEAKIAIESCTPVQIVENERLAEPLPCADMEVGVQNQSEETPPAETPATATREQAPWIYDSIDIDEQILIKREIQNVHETEYDDQNHEDEGKNLKMEEEINWTRDEDKAILLVLQCESDLNFTFEKIRKLLPHRSIEEIRERFQSVMQLLQQMASDK